MLGVLFVAFVGGAAGIFITCAIYVAHQCDTNPSDYITENYLHNALYFLRRDDMDGAYSEVYSAMYRMGIATTPEEDEHFTRIANSDR